VELVQPTALSLPGSIVEDMTAANDDCSGHDEQPATLLISITASDVQPLYGGADIASDEEHPSLPLPI